MAKSCSRYALTAFRHRLKLRGAPLGPGDGNRARAQGLPTRKRYPLGRTVRTHPMNARAAAGVMAAAAACIWCSDNSAPPLALYSGEWNGDDGRLEGDLIRQGNCLLVEDVSGKRWVIAFAVEGTSWSERENAVTYLGTTLRVGKYVEVGGSSPSGFRPTWKRAPSDDCGPADTWLVGDPSPG